MKSKRLTIKLGLQGELSGRLKISIVSTGNMMPYFLSDFKTELGVDLILDVTKKQVLESLENNEVDF
jgi:hypothetical protein